MHQTITGFHLDEQNDWVAELVCDHFQHVRHNPPWTNRDWVEHQQGRQSAIGKTLDCKKCDRSEPKDK